LKNHFTTKFGQLIARKIIKIIVIICQILGLKCTKIYFGWGSATNPAGEITALPKLHSWNKGNLLLRGRKRVQKGEKEERVEKVREGTGKRGREKVGESIPCVGYV